MDHSKCEKYKQAVDDILKLTYTYGEISSVTLRNVVRKAIWGTISEREAELLEQIDTLKKENIQLRRENEEDEGLPDDLDSLRKMGFGLWSEMGWGTSTIYDNDFMRGRMSAVLKRKVVSRKSLSKDEWKTWIRYCREQLSRKIKA